jgi:uncharacterized membrane protein YkgB
MSTNPTQRHTARPSRSRVTRARVGAWIDDHADGITIGAIIALVAILTTLSALILATDYGVSVSHLLGNATLSLSAVAMSAFFAWIIASDRTARRVASVWAKERNRERAQHERDTAYLVSRMIGAKEISDMSAYEMSAELARMTEREYQMRYALRYAVSK